LYNDIVVEQSNEMSRKNYLRNMH